MNSSIDTQFDYFLRESSRARSVTLKVSRDRGLEVVVPVGFDQALVPDVLSSRLGWIESQLEKFSALPGRFDQNWPPQHLALSATGQTFEVEYQEVQGERLRLNQDDNQIIVQLPKDTENDSLVQLIVRWLKTYAKLHFPVVAAELSDESGLDFEKVVVRGQRTRWGSYSSKGTLSLNYKLLFLPDFLFRHVILHELSHTVHMNHSDEFWNLLHSLDENTQQHDKALRDAWRYIPSWLD